MDIQRTSILDLIDAFENLLGWEKLNQLAHVTLCDNYITDSAIDDNIARLQSDAAQIIAEARQDHDLDITEKDVAMTVAFLTFLKSIPEDERFDWEDDGE